MSGALILLPPTLLYLPNNKRVIQRRNGSATTGAGSRDTVEEYQGISLGSKRAAEVDRDGAGAGECVVENGRLIESRPFYMAFSNIQALALLDESKGSNGLP
jgi:hypothetical protein